MILLFSFILKVYINVRINVHGAKCIIRSTKFARNPINECMIISALSCLRNSLSLPTPLRYLPRKLNL
jgi:hypothetical protein